ncbi:uncharacterized protein BCR38DRAFT_412625 [Pseudomassariella vexata]|uniref:Short chain dehydrogenase n=1 Tax=Pseudomassariella vexata TaxID=1141098 RepID=A0A1Y2DKH4_9PEZI|nr:uncharacterized protein BCR38DRAFT_412625 [Pseudomassariella vexata]ORY59626.1 hypothetical protein BCR38DRAFT_412625 [Pseudomassariella vexata]
MSQKTVLITGCSSGIGQALALEFAAHNYRVLATARDASSLVALKDSKHGGCIETLSLEVHKPESIAALKSQVEALTAGRGLDILVNNAGRNYTVPALDIDHDEVHQLFEVNVFAVMRMCQAFAPLLITAKGRIVQIGSVAGVIPYVFGSVYNASKAALHQYSNTLRVELKPFGVDVITVVTGGVQSNIARIKRELPKGSVYAPIAEEYRERVMHSQADGSMASEVYAKSVVKAITGSRAPLYYWEGYKARTIWWITTFLPAWTMDWVFTTMFKLWKLVPGKAKEA